MDPRRFQIGDVVQVLATVHGGYDVLVDGNPGYNQRRLIRDVLDGQPRWGRVVGLTRIQLGRYHDACEIERGDDMGPGWEPPFLSITKTIPVWLVRFGLFNRPVLVQDEDLKPHRILFGGHPPPLPLLYTNSWTKVARKGQADDMRKIMKDWPRDSKGRWKKENQ